VPPIGTRGRDGERQHSCRPAGWRREPVAEGGATLSRHDGGGGRWRPEVPPFFRALGQGTRGPPLPPHPMGLEGGWREQRLSSSRPAGLNRY
jgi:hypothetical protein